jgi:hypothetical protein
MARACCRPSARPRRSGPWSNSPTSACGLRRGSVRRIRRKPRKSSGRPKRCSRRF